MRITWVFAMLAVGGCRPAARPETPTLSAMKPSVCGSTQVPLPLPDDVAIIGAVGLPGGQVLLTGLAGPFDAPRGWSAIVEPLRGEWRVVDVPSPHDPQAVTALSTGDVLGLATRATFVFESVSARWRVSAAGPAPCAGAPVALTGGRALIVGPACAAAFDGERWRTVPAPPVARSGFSLTALADGRVLLTGGIGLREEDTEATTETHLLDAALTAWQPAAPLHEARFGHVAALLRDGTVVVAGGCRANHGEFDVCTEDHVHSIETSDPAVTAWSAEQVAWAGRLGHAIVVLGDGRVWVLGGHHGDSGDVMPTLERYGGWRMAQPTADRRDGHVAVALSDGETALVVGGHSGDPGPAAQLYHLDGTCPRWPATSEE